MSFAGSAPGPPGTRRPSLLKRSDNAGVFAARLRRFRFQTPSSDAFDLTVTSSLDPGTPGPAKAQKRIVPTNSIRIALLG